MEEAKDIMTPNATTLELNTPVKEVLAYVPVRHTTEYPKGHLIYGRNTLRKNIYLVVTGTVGITQIAEDGSEVLMEVVPPDELFGPLVFLNIPDRFERATAMETSSLMTWPLSDLEDLVMKQPRLAVALLQILAQRNAEFARRIESFAIDSIEQRLARSLLRFSERLGTPEEDGSVRIMAFTPKTLARYVGTSREIVTQHMTRFRKQGWVSYSRKGIRLRRDALRTVFD